MQELKAGDVVYLRGDLGMEAPMTVKQVNIGPDRYVDVAWLDVNKQVCTFFAARAAFMTDAEQHLLMLERCDLHQKADREFNQRKPRDY